MAIVNLPLYVAATGIVSTSWSNHHRLPRRKVDLDTLSSMTQVRAFTQNDIVEVADLFTEVFLRDQETDCDDLRDHFKAVYFDNPFRDDDCPPLVYRDDGGEIVAFLGVTPRRMRYRGETIKAAIAGNLMVKGAAAGGGGSGKPASNGRYQLAPAALTKAFFRCPHDLGLSDSAIDASRRIWERSGGEVVRLYSLRWLCVLKPFSLGTLALERSGRLKTLCRLSKPISALADGALRPVIAWAEPSMLADCRIENVQPDEMVEELARCRHYELLPSYSAANLGWVLEMAASRRHYGKLRAFVARDKSGVRLGWAIYTGKPGDIGYLLQLYAQPTTIDRVLNCLYVDAANAGIVALSGKADPLFMNHLIRRNSALRFRAWTLAQARRPELLLPLLTGKAMFSELESEGWTRFLRARPIHEFSTL